nr:stage III sporulation protein AE [uncultured Blautia sp.]
MKGGIGKRVKAAACVLAVLFLVLSAAVEVKASFFSANAGQEVMKNQPQGTVSQDGQPNEEAKNKTAQEDIAGEAKGEDGSAAGEAKEEDGSAAGEAKEEDGSAAGEAKEEDGSAAGEAIGEDEDTAEPEEEKSEEEIRQDTQSATAEKLMDDMEMEQMQDAINELLGEESFSLEDALHKILSGDKLFSKEYFMTLIKNFLYKNLAAERDTMIHVVLLVLMAALFSNFSNVFNNGQMGEISFYIVYMLLLAALVHSFGTLSIEISEGLTGFVTFMKALMPSYFLAVTAATGSATAMVFYEVVLVLVYVVQVIFLKGVLPGIHIYVLLQLVNFLHSEDFLSKMAELVRTVVEWTMRTCIAVVIGMQIIQNMIGPAIDTLKRDVIGKTAAAIPGIGNAINGVTEVALGTAVLVRNGLGVIGMIVILCVGLPPVIRLGMTTLLYKLLAAIVQPISDKRMVGALATIGDGCMLLLKVLLTMELLFLITIAVLTISFIGH